MQYTMGETVVAVSDNVKGEVTYVDDFIVRVQWTDAKDVPVVYPTETESVRKLWPWEQNS